MDSEVISLLESINKKLDNINPSQDEILDTADICRLLKISKRSVADLKASGRIPFYKLSGKHYYKYSEIEKLLFKK
jgi:excisionase family DNA binding protein